MTRLDDLAAVVWLACETGDRDNREHKALVAVARQVDKEWNRQTGTNWRLDRTQPSVVCTYPGGVHDRTCPCKGDVFGVRVPRGGWSMLELLAENTRDAS